ncbi:NAD-dependent succinate-semialdehyde dehydrogenase [Kiloniella antarctica]|uniref:NAD-dependent succinate-semialdehyde dehydrogenase n=1 Tax=Kiloniella antarctica TaxID=1550907 RepID=A0ABW5BIJ1_9PROT
MELKDPSLLRNKCYIDGTWADADSGETFAVTNPANGDIITSVPKMGESETKRAIDAAQTAFGPWKDRTAKERSQIMRKWFELIMANQEDLALLMTLEQGKPLAEAMGEVAYGASFVEWFAEECKRIYGDTIPEHLPGRRLIVNKEPIGVVAAITPWNFPIAMITRKCAPAIAAGCTVVIKPAEDTPLSAFALAELAERAGIPKGVMNIVSGIPQQIGKALTESKIVRKLTFTGSTPVGKLLMKQCADTVKKTSMELGGNAPFIVFEDADLDAAVEGAMMSKFRNAGQTCVCSNRILVQEGVYDAFAKKLVEKVAALKVAPGTEEGAQQGPLINAAASSKVSELINDAVSKGAKTIIGGNPHDLGGTFFEPTVITGVTDEMRVFSEEIFGPVAPLYKFKTEEEAVKMANDTPFGLAAYFYSRDIGRVWRVSRALEYGIVGINEGIISNEVAPFGGVKESGVGREGSKYGMEDFLEIKYLCMGGI